VGSCVITTNCQDQDLSQTEFAFNCFGEGGDGGIVRHSFGMGGFDAQEEFDTEVKCDRCGKASPVDSKATDADSSKEISTPNLPAQPVRAPVSSNNDARTASGFWSVSQKREDVSMDAVRYGPNSCVSTYKNEKGHCIMQTACQKVDTSNYNFGLVCVDRIGAPVRHLFGQDSFDPEETFDTQITCDQCLGLEDIPDPVALNAGVTTMSAELSKLRKMMQDIGMQVKRLNAKVLSSPNSFIQAGVHKKEKRRVHVARRYLRHGHKRHLHKKKHYETDADMDSS